MVEDALHTLLNIDFWVSPVNTNAAWCHWYWHFQGIPKMMRQKQLQKTEPGYSSSPLLHMNKQKVTNFSFSFTFKMLIQIPDNALLLFSHLFVLGVCLFSSGNTLLLNQCEAWEPAQLQSSLSCSNDIVRESLPCSRVFWHNLLTAGVSAASHRDFSWKLK